MGKEKIIASLDIGSSKISTVIVSNLDNRVSVIGNSVVQSTGVDRGVINDIDKAVEAISLSVERAEKMAGVSIQSAVVSINGNHLRSENSTGVVAITNTEGEVRDQDIDRVEEAAGAVSIPSNREVIHSIPRDFVVDGEGNIKDPKGMSGVRLEVESHVIHGSSTVVKNIYKAVNSVGINIDQLVFTGLSSAQSVLTNTEKELGILLLDIGARTTSGVVYLEGSPYYSFVVPIGGKHVSSDIAIGLKTSIESAEKIKLKISREDPSKSETLTIEDLDSRGVKGNKLNVRDIDPSLENVDKKYVETIVEERLKEIFSMVLAEVTNQNILSRLPGGVVLTGGACLTKGSKITARRILKVPVRVGYPRGLTGLTDEIEDTAFSSVAGGILYKLKYNHKKQEEFSINKINRKSIEVFARSSIDFFKSLLP